MVKTYKAVIGKGASVHYVQNRCYGVLSACGKFSRTGKQAKGKITCRVCAKTNGHRNGK